MCRKTQLWGFVLMSFGLGVLIGTWLSAGFMCNCLGFGLIILGFCVLRRK